MDSRTCPAANKALSGGPDLLARGKSPARGEIPPAGGLIPRWIDLRSWRERRGGGVRLARTDLIALSGEAESAGGELLPLLGSARMGRPRRAGKKKATPGGEMAVETEQV